MKRLVSLLALCALCSGCWSDQFGLWSTDKPPLDQKPSNEPATQVIEECK